MNFKNTILLTGAGFTANFGGFLAREMWSKIFNNPSLNAAGNIKLALHDNFDFEDMYSSVFDDRRLYSQDELDIYENVVTEAYLSMNDYLIAPENKEKNAKMSKNVLDFLNKFLTKSEDKVGGYFTLNQDLFPEIEYDWTALGPSLNQVTRPNGSVILPSQEELSQYVANMPEIEFCYAKLHGSVNWLQEDGSETMVLGINKLEAINNVPLLKWYFELFNQAITSGGTKLLIIGYGFKDKHINKCLFDAINSHGLQLYVISPEEPARFKRKLTIKGEYDGYNGRITEQDNEGITIWRAVKAYFPYKLSDIFPHSGERTAALDEILKTLG